MGHSNDDDRPIGRSIDDRSVHGSFHRSLNGPWVISSIIERSMGHFIENNGSMSYFIDDRSVDG